MQSSMAASCSEVGHLLGHAERARMPRAEPQAPEVRRGELGGDVLEAVVTGIAAALLDLHAAGRQVKLVVNDEDLIGRDLVVERKRHHGVARAVHVGRGLEKPDVAVADPRPADLALELPLVAEEGARLARELVDEPEAGVVAGAGVFPRPTINRIPCSVMTFNA